MTNQNTSGRMPISQIDWPTFSTHRMDIFTDPYEDRMNNHNNRVTVPFHKDESTYLQWNGDPFEKGCSSTGNNKGRMCGSGKAEYPGTVYLMPYWMYRFQIENTRK